MPKTIIRLLIVLGVPLLIGIVSFFYLRSFFLSPADSKSTKEVIVEVKPGSSFRSFCKKLSDEGIVNHWWALDFMSQIKKSDTQIQAGEYLLSPSMTPRQIMAKLSKGDVHKRIVLIREGEDLWQVAEALEAADVVKASSFIKSATDPDLLTRMEFDGASLEGYLFPETYYFSGQQSVINVIWRFVDEFNKNWPEAYDARIEELGFTMNTVNEVLTLASIIEKESGNFKEQPRISAVFHNRLRSGIKLESDPTLVYGLRDFGGTVLNKHKDRETPYNTYRNFGLPPGPICNPGKTAIEAALYPLETEELFFVADGHGGHVFSKTLKEHNVAVRKYRNLIKERKKGSANGASQPDNSGVK